LEEIEKLEKIVTELLDFASRSSSKLVVKDLNLVIEHTLFLIKKQCKQQKVRLVERLNPSLPPVQLDPEKIKQALLNILLNAITVLPNGGEITILTRHHQRLEFLGGKKGVEIKICDNGPGISQDDIEYIFDPFFTRNPKGSGLGLSITHTIIDEHNGKIIVESDHTNGAVFRIFLPLSVTKLG
jgi:signal transduction histidine kinase